MKYRYKAIMTLLLGLCLMSFEAFSQNRTITGVVSSASDATPLIGASVVVKGAATGTVSDFNGNYSLEVPEGATLVFSYVGYVTQTMAVGDQKVINVSLKEGTELDEVVVTALGVSREKKALGYAITEVSGDDLVQGNESNFINNLSGKVSGIQIQAAQGIGGSSRILLRGANSILGENQPLFVVDGIPIDNSNYGSFRQAYGSRDDGSGNVDYGNAAQDINPSDVESVSLLTGASGAALYGSRGANGVILITTKRGKVGASKIEVNFANSTESVWDLPPLQNDYGGGRNGTFVIGDDGIPIQDVTTDESWGPKLNGQMVRQWDGNGKGGEVRPWVAHPDNYKNFFETGTTRNANIAISGGAENINYRLSLTNRNQKGIVPNSRLQNNTVSLNLGTKHKKFSVTTTLNYYNRKGEGRPSTGGSSDNLVYNLVIWTQRQLDIERLKQYENPDGSQRTWRTGGVDQINVKANNPYWLAYKDVQTDRKDRLIGNISLTYDFTDKLSLMVRGGQDWYTDNRNNVRAVGSRYTPYYINDNINYRQQNYDFLTSYKMTLSDMSVNVNFGGSILKENIRRVKSATNGGLKVPGIHTIFNSIDPPSISTSLPNKEIQSLYGMLSLGYKNFLYLDATGRNDWSSTLPADNNSYFYPSFSTSLVFSELLTMDVISYGKLRLGWGQVGKDTGPYRILQTYSASQSVGGNPVFKLPSSLNNASLKPEITTSQEVGLELKFLKNRIGLDVTLYSSSSKNQILPITVSPTTGYSSKWVNAGEISNKGVELGLSVTPVKTKDFKWDVKLNWGKNTNEIVSLPNGINSILHATFYSSGGSRVFLESRVGEPFSSIYATKIATDTKGNRIVRNNDASTPGSWLPAEEATFIGSVLPNWTAGINNSFNYKSFNLSFLFDVQNGGVIFLRGYQTALYAGTMIETAENGIRENGIILDGVWEDGTKNNIVLDAKTYSRLKRRTPGDHTVFDASFVKLREVAIGYDLPSSILNKTFFSGARISLVGRNLAILKRNTPDGYDPESAGNTSGNLQGREYGQLPGARSVGFNLSLEF